MRALLIPTDGGEQVEINKDMTIVGRKEDCDLRLDHKSVSKLHCAIVKTDGLLLLRDLGSTNGTRVNGQRVRRAALLPNDQLGIANYKYRVFLGPDMPPTSNEHTMRLEADEVASMMDHLDQRSPRERTDGPSVQANALPDVYDSDSSSNQ